MRSLPGLGMWFWPARLLLGTLFLLAGCARLGPARQAQPPAVRPTQAVVDLAAYDVTRRVFPSPSGDLAIEILRGEWTERSKGESDYNQYTVYDRQQAARWALQEWTRHGMGEGVPARAAWSADERSIWIDERMAREGCGGIVYANLRRLDLASGRLEPAAVPGLGNAGFYAISPDGAWLALIGEGQLEIIDLARGQKARAIPFEPLTSQPAGPRDAPVWSPDGSRLAFQLEAPIAQCGGGSPAESAIVLVDPGGASRRVPGPFYGRLAGWKDARTLKVVDPLAKESWLDVESGQVITEE